MRRFFAIAIFGLVFWSCNRPNTTKKLLTRDNLPVKEYTILADRDTTLQTDKGALLKIPAGALKPDKGNSVTLEIREAYSLADMIKAGLVTQSDGKPLASGGMIYIGAAKGQNVSFHQPIKVAIPADNLQQGMQLYKGEESDGKVNWTSPTSLPENSQLTSIDTGKIIFQTKCASCHAIGRDLTGPDLAHFPKRFNALTLGAEGLPRNWYHGIFNWSLDGTDKSDSIKATIWMTDSENRDLAVYVCNLIHRWGSMGTPFNLNWHELMSLYRYIQNESDRRNLPLPSSIQIKNCTDSCIAYQKLTEQLIKIKNANAGRRKNLVDENGELSVVNPDSTRPITNVPISDELRTSNDFEAKVLPNNFNATYYQFTFDSFGWYNIDQLISDRDDVEESELLARVVGNQDKVNIFLIIPSVKMYTEGGPSSEDNWFAFYLKNGKIPLPQNVDAYILAVSESDSSLAYGLKKFTTSRQQEIEISLSAASKAQFNDAMGQFEAQRLHIKVADTKNANEIRKEDVNLKKIDEQLREAEKLKPKNCDCNCGGLSAKPAVISGRTIPEGNSQNDLLVKAFPNPSTNYFTVKISSNNLQDGMIILTTDIGGRILESKNSFSPGQTFAIGENYRPGTYLLVVRQGKSQRTIKLVKQ